MLFWLSKRFRLSNEYLPEYDVDHGSTKDDLASTNLQTLTTDGVGKFLVVVRFPLIVPVPPAQKWYMVREHRLNCSRALVKAAEVSHFKDLCQQPATTLQGIGRLFAASNLALWSEYYLKIWPTIGFHLAIGDSNLGRNEKKDDAWNRQS
jgi:hypothetical protein